MGEREGRDERRHIDDAAAHSEGGRQYKAYDDQLASERSLTLYDADESVRFAGSQQLVDLGFVREPDEAGALPVEMTPVTGNVAGVPRSIELSNCSPLRNEPA